MVESNRLKGLVRSYMDEYPGTKYRQALAIVKAADDAGTPPPPPTAVATDQFDHIPGFLEALGIENIDTYDFADAWSGREDDPSLRVPYALRRDGDTVLPELDYLDVVELIHGGVGGRTGTGKSYLLRTLVLAMAATHSPDKVNFAIADFKGSSTFAGFDRIPHTAINLSGLGGDPAEARSFFARIAAEANRRAELITKQHACTDIFEYRKRNGPDSGAPRLPHLIVVIDEFVEHLLAYPEQQRDIESVAMIGRALGIHLILASQGEGVDSVAFKGLQRHLSFGISLMVTSPAASDTLIGSDAATKLPTGKGAALRRFDSPGSGPEVAAITALASQAPVDESGRTADQALIDRLSEYPRTAEELPAAGEGARPASALREAEVAIDAIIGQDEVKAQLRLILEEARFAAELRRRGKLVPNVVERRNFLFTGPPGSGKTHVAYVLAQVLNAAGLLTRPSVLMTGRHPLVGQFEGQTSHNVHSTFQEARGGVLFIDAASELVQGREGDDRFGLEAAHAVLAQIDQNHGEISVILAGYEPPMRDLFQRVPGFTARFPNVLRFESLSAEKLWEHMIRLSLTTGYSFGPRAEEAFLERSSKTLGHVDKDGRKGVDRMGNFRFSKAVFDQAVMASSRRMAQSGNLSELSDEDLMQITAEDVDTAVKQVISGFGGAS